MKIEFHSRNLKCFRVRLELCIEQAAKKNKIKKFLWFPVGGGAMVFQLFTNCSSPFLLLLLPVSSSSSYLPTTPHRRARRERARRLTSSNFVAQTVVHSRKTRQSNASPHVRRTRRKVESPSIFKKKKNLCVFFFLFCF